MSTPAAVATQSTLKQSVNRLDELPSMPVIAQKLLSLDLDSDEGEGQMLRLISQEPVISARIIGMANSPLVGAARKVSTVNDAALLLGLKRVKSVATAIAVMTKIEKPAGRLDIHKLWSHNWEAAYTMLAIRHAMPAKLRPNEDILFLTGMLHDIGYLVLAYLDTPASDRLQTYLASPDARGQDILAVESQMLGITHTDLGADLAQHWQLPPDVVSAIRLHHITFHDANDSKGKPDDDETLLPPLIASIAERLTEGELTLEDRLATIVDAEWEILGIDTDKVPEVAQNAQELAKQADEMISSLY